MAISCCREKILTARNKLPPIQVREINVQCCFVHGGDGWIVVDENIALKHYSDSKLYFLDSQSWENLLKSTAERDGRIREYEQFPCVK